MSLYSKIAFWVLVFNLQLIWPVNSSPYEPPGWCSLPIF